jgi:thiamine-phosphate pyrophosphorylase
MKGKISGYYFVTDSGLSIAGDEDDVRSAVRAGAGIIQYRDKEAGGMEMLERAKRLRSLCGGALFIVNDRVDVALACGAGGVHLGQDDLPCETARKILGKRAVIGVTVHSAAEARKALSDGADYLGVSPIFATGTKKDAGPAAGVKLVEEIRVFSPVPIVAIGGINLENAQSVIRAGADAVCAISCVVTKIDVEAEVRKFQALFQV